MWGTVPSRFEGVRESNHETGDHRGLRADASGRFRLGQRSKGSGRNKAEPARHGRDDPSGGKRRGHIFRRSVLERGRTSLSADLKLVIEWRARTGSTVNLYALSELRE